MNDYYGLATEAVEDVGLLTQCILLAQLLRCAALARWYHFCVVEVDFLNTHHKHGDGIHEHYLALVVVRRIRLLIAPKSIVTPIVLQGYYK